MTLRLVIPGKPGGKRRPRASVMAGRVHMRTPKETVNAEAVIRERAMAAGARPIDGPVVVSIKAVFPVAASWPKKRREAALGGAPYQGKPDADNIIKLVCDALNGVAYGDDAQVCDARCVRIYGPEPRMAILVRPWSPPAQPAPPSPHLRQELGLLRRADPAAQSDYAAMQRLGAALRTLQHPAATQAADVLAALAPHITEDGLC